MRAEQLKNILRIACCAIVAQRAERIASEYLLGGQDWRAHRLTGTLHRFASARATRSECGIASKHACVEAVEPSIYGDIICRACGRRRARELERVGAGEAVVGDREVAP